MDAPVLLTGAVRCIVRQPDRLRPAAPTTQIVQGDCLDEASLDRALAGVRCACRSGSPIAPCVMAAERDGP